MKGTNSGIVSIGCLVWMAVKIKLNTEHHEINMGTQTILYIFQRSHFFIHKLLTVTIQQVFNSSYDFYMPSSDCYCFVGVR